MLVVLAAGPLLVRCTAVVVHGRAQLRRALPVAGPAGQELEPGLARARRVRRHRVRCVLGGARRVGASLDRLPRRGGADHHSHRRAHRAPCHPALGHLPGTRHVRLRPDLGGDVLQQRADVRPEHRGSADASSRRSCGLDTDLGYYYLVLAVVAACTLFLVLLQRMRLGRLLRGLGESPVALETSGASVRLTKLIVFCLSSGMAAVAGALYGSTFTNVGRPLLPVVQLADPARAAAAHAGRGRRGTP